MSGRHAVIVVGAVGFGVLVLALRNTATTRKLTFYEPEVITVGPNKPTQDEVPAAAVMADPQPEGAYGVFGIDW